MAESVFVDTNPLIYLLDNVQPFVLPVKNFLLKYKNLNAVLFDLKGVTSAAKQNAREYDLKDRIKFISKDADKDDIGGGYDLIICMNLFYFTRDVTRICEKIYKALNKNGIFLLNNCNQTQHKNVFYFHN